MYLAEADSDLAAVSTPNNWFHSRLKLTLDLMLVEADTFLPDECSLHRCHTVRFQFAQTRILIFDKQRIVSTIAISGTERLGVGLWWLLVWVCV